MSEKDNNTKPFVSGRIEKKISSWQYVIYGIYLLLLIFLAILQITQRNTQIVVNDDIGLYNALRRPFEGKWQYEVEWEKFHGDTTNKYKSDGEALFLWSNKNKQYKYKIFIGYEIKQHYEEPCVIAYAIGEWETDINGNPLDKKHFQLEYGGRMGTNSKPYEKASTRKLDFNNVKFEYKDNRINVMTAEYNFIASTGKITFQRH